MSRFHSPTSRSASSRTSRLRIERELEHFLYQSLTKGRLLDNLILKLSHLTHLLKHGSIVLESSHYELWAETKFERPERRRNAPASLSSQSFSDMLQT